MAMSFMDKVKDTASKAAEGVQKAADAGQDKLEEQKLKKKVSNLKEELGDITFAQRTGAAPADAEDRITRIVGEIQATEAGLEELRADS
jgi:hypothetical protein